jgi:microcystin degradation protein MlrC
MPAKTSSKSALRIAVDGFMHETNTFVPRPTTFDDFAVAQQYPGLCFGEDMLRQVAGRNLGVTGFSEVATKAGHRVMPICWSFAQPGGIVTDHAFERIAAMIIEPLGFLDPDVVFLELHGAMVTESREDGEGELIRRVRAVVGPDVPIVCTLDLHGNISRASVETASFMTAYRTYPHVDWGDTGRRAARFLPQVMRWGARPTTAFERFDALVPVVAQSTYTEPGRSLYGLIEGLERQHGVGLSLMMGFPPADIAECGPCVFGYGGEQKSVDAAVNALMTALRKAEPAYAAHKPLPAARAVERAIAVAAKAKRPVVIADTADNAGAGASSSTTGMARELLKQEATDAMVLIAHEPEVAAAAHAAGIGATIEATLGVYVDGPGQEPLNGPWTVEKLSDGEFTGTGPMLGGAHCRLGPTAVIRKAGVRVLVGSIRQQPLSRNTIRHLGIDPSKLGIIVVKSSVHFRNDFQDFAEEVIVADSPGANPPDRRKLKYRRLPKTMLRELREA